MPQLLHVQPRREAEQVRELLPTEEESQDMFGVSIGYRRVTDRGMEIKSVTELPR